MKPSIIDKDSSSMSMQISVKQLGLLLEIGEKAASKEYQRIIDVLQIKNRPYLILKDLIEVDLL